MKRRVGLGHGRVVGLGLGVCFSSFTQSHPNPVRRAAWPPPFVRLPGMPGQRRDTVAFTVVVTVLVLLGAAGMLLVLAPVRSARARCWWRPCWPRCPWCRWWPATSGWTATSPSPAACWRRACSGAASSPPRRPSSSQGIGGIFGGISDDTSLAVVAPVTEEATKGAFLLLLLWWRRAELDGVLDGIVYAGMVGIGFAFVENILYLAAAYNGTDGIGPGGTDGADGDVRGALPVQPVRAPLLHQLHRHRRRASRSPAGPAPLRILAPLLGYLLRRGRPRPLERLDDLRRRRTSSSSTSC